MIAAAGWTPRALLAVGWTPSDLRAAGWTPSDLRAAGWTPSALRAAGWTPSDLRAAGWTPSDLLVEDKCKLDVQGKARKMDRSEAAFVVSQLKGGLLDGSKYGTVKECGCFLGTAARAAGVSVDKFCERTGIVRDGSSPAEQWFMGITIEPAASRARPNSIRRDTFIDFMAM